MKVLTKTQLGLATEVTEEKRELSGPSASLIRHDSAAKPASRNTHRDSKGHKGCLEGSGHANITGHAFGPGKELICCLHKRPAGLQLSRFKLR